MAKKDKKKKLAQIKIGNRICRDIVTGLIVSFLLCVVMTKLYDIVCVKILALGFSLPEFNYQDLFFTELSIAFLVISFVTLLANKTEDVYWVDVIQYRLVKPDFFSIVDISSYIFANMIISLFAYLIPTRWNLLLFSFVQIILLLGLLSLKLLMAFFGIDDLKKELASEYEKALDFRKTIILISTYDNENLSYDSFYHDSAVSSVKKFSESHELFDKLFYLKRAIQHFLKSLFKETIPNIIVFLFDTDDNIYSDIAPIEFRESSTVDYREISPREVHDSTIEQMYRKIISGTIKRPISSFYLFRLYIKLYKYSLKFDGNTQAHAEMMDSLYTNTINAIENKQVKKACEHISFMFSYKEYQPAMSCMLCALNNCPAIFVKVFSYIQDICINSPEYVVMLNDMIVSFMQLPEFNFYKDTSFVKQMYFFMSKECTKFIDTSILINQYHEALEKSNNWGIEAIYNSFSRMSLSVPILSALHSWAEQSYNYIYKVVFLFERVSKYSRISDKTIKSVSEFMRCHYEELISPQNDMIDDLYKEAFDANNYDVVKRFLVAHCQWIEKRIADTNEDLWIWHLEKDVRDKFLFTFLTPYDLSKVYKELEDHFRKRVISDDQFFSCVNSIGECYDVLRIWEDNAVKEKLLQEFNKNIIVPLSELVAEQNCKVSAHYTLSRAESFWREVDSPKK